MGQIRIERKATHMITDPKYREIEEIWQAESDDLVHNGSFLVFYAKITLAWRQLSATASAVINCFEVC